MRLELPESRDKINKMNLKNKKAEMQRKYEEVEQYFTIDEPYYREMLDMVKDKKRRNREFAMAIKQKQIRELKRDPITGEYESDKEWEDAI